MEKGGYEKIYVEIHINGVKKDGGRDGEMQRGGL